MRIDQQLETAQTLERDDAAIAQCAHSSDQCGITLRNGFAAGIQHGKLRPTIRTGVRLGVKTPVGRCFVFGAAGRTHFEMPHGGVGAIVGKRFEDAEARTAVGAIGERVPIAPIGRFEQFAQAVATGGNVGNNQSGRRAGAETLANSERGVACRCQLLRVHTVDPRQRRQLLSQMIDKALDCILAAF